MDEESLLAAVGAAYAVTGAGLPSWPDPWPDGPDRDAHGRVTDPSRHRVVGARAAAWLRTLTDLGLAEVTGTSDGPLAWTQVDSDWTATHLRPHRDGALPAIVAVRAFAVEHDGVALGIGTPPTFVGLAPLCGCDACDAGSDALLDEVDVLFLHVVASDYRRTAGPDWSVGHSDYGYSWTGGDPPQGAGTRAARAAARAARAGRVPAVTTVVSRAWLAPSSDPAGPDSDEGSAGPGA